MKNAKKIMALLLVAVMTLALALPVFAVPTDGKITITNAKTETDYTIYKLFGLTYEPIDGEADPKVAYTATEEVKDWLADNDSIVREEYKDGTNVYTVDILAKELFTFTKNASGTYNVTRNTKVKRNIDGTDKDVPLMDADIIDFLTLSVQNDDLPTEVVSAAKTKNSGSSEIVEFTGLEYGYYLIKSGVGALVTIDSTLKEVKVNDKNVEKELSKKIKVWNSTTSEYEYVDVSTANIGEVVTYKITVPLEHYARYSGNSSTDDIEKINAYYVFDTMNSALTPVTEVKKVGTNDYQNVVKINSANIVSKKSDGTTSSKAFTGYTIDMNDSGTATWNFRINIPTLYEKETAAADSYDGLKHKGGDFMYKIDDVIEFEYAAIVNEKIAADINGMKNTVNLDWTTVPNEPGDIDTPPDPPEEPTIDEHHPKATVTTYNTTIQLKKVDAVDNTEILTGAKFKIQGVGTVLNSILLNLEEFAPYDEDVDKTGVELDTSGNIVKYWLRSDDGYTKTDPSTISDTEIVKKYYDDPTKTFMKVTKVVTERFRVYDDTTMAGQTWYEVSGSDPVLYYLLTDGNYTTVEPGTDTTNYPNTKYADTTTSYVKVTATDLRTVPTGSSLEAYVDENGLLTFKGLGEGTYKITELVAPDGYNLLKDPIDIVITPEYDSTGTKLTKWNYKYVFDGTDLSTSTTAEDGSTTAMIELKVENNYGTELPQTGAAGSKLFVALGSLAVIGAGIVLVSNKRASKELDF